ncbi:MAG: RtcB family protein [Hoeflea sp.]|jgi:tRNA-splicing ligase RtcB (3'-phosphate/5'-hydroxy nucleic acid ligase)|uniref:RtcB family protein n=1 Tax=Hoeflea sp. TaxID=1940281 RepID=UPI0032EDE9EE
MTDKINGHDLIAAGFTPGPQFPQMIDLANQLIGDGHSREGAFAEIREQIGPEPEPIALRTNNLPFGDFLGNFIDRTNGFETTNYRKVVEHMDALMRVPVIRAGAIMPDACVAGTAMGTIPVGGVVAAENAILPDMHSSDVCCSMAVTIFKRNDDPKKVLDTAQAITHFGPGKRAKSFVRQHKDLGQLLSTFGDNSFLSGLEGKAEEHFMTQGDGNHFLFLGHLESTGQMAMVTHHGSRGLGAQLFKRGRQFAQRSLRNSRIPKHQAWIVADTAEGQAYWDALQKVRLWTKMNHFAIHNAIARKIGNAVDTQFWNEHNFVFQRADGLFYHGKGATPSFKGFSPDDTGLTLIPMNMASPILIASHADNINALGFAPHGAGRNMSRTQFLKNYDPEPPEGIDYRFYSGVPDYSELPEAYKDQRSVIRGIKHAKLANVVDRIMPYGSIMGGEFRWGRP